MFVIYIIVIYFFVKFLIWAYKENKKLNKELNNNNRRGR